MGFSQGPQFPHIPIICIILRVVTLTSHVSALPYTREIDLWFGNKCVNDCLFLLCQLCILCNADGISDQFKMKLFARLWWRDCFVIRTEMVLTCSGLPEKNPWHSGKWSSTCLNRFHMGANPRCSITAPTSLPLGLQARLAPEEGKKEMSKTASLEDWGHESPVLSAVCPPGCQSLNRSAASAGFIKCGPTST